MVVASAGQDNEDQLASQLVISTDPPSSDKPLAYTVSNSWENDDEIISGVLEENAFNTILEVGAARA